MSNDCGLELDMDEKGTALDRTTVWRRAHIVFAVLLLAWVTLYGPTLRLMVRAWVHTGTYQYAFLIFPIVIWLIWNQRHVVSTKAVGSEKLAVLGIALAGILWLLGALVSVNVVQQFSVIAMLPCLVLICYGRAIAKALMFPLGYLFFAVPYGNFLVSPLRTITARISVRLLQLSGATVFLNGHLIEVPVGSFEVADACSGIKFFIATTALGTLYAHLFYRSWRRRLVFVFAALIVPIIANGLRVYFTILIGQTFGMQYATGTDHMIFGWQFFGSVLVLLFLAGWHWRQDPLPSGPAGRPVVKSIPLARVGLVAVLTVIGLLAGPTVAYVTTPDRVPVGAGRQLNARLLGQQNAAPVLPGTDPISAGFQNADVYLHALYRQGRAPIWVYIAQYRGVPQHGHEVLDFSNRIYPKHWRALSERELIADRRPVTQLHLQHDSRHWLVWYWYQVNGRAVTSSVVVKLLQLWQRIAGSASTRAAMVRLATPADSHGWRAANQVLTDFYDKHYSRISQLLH